VGLHAAEFQQPAGGQFRSRQHQHVLGEYHVDGFRWDAASAIITAKRRQLYRRRGNLLNAINEMIHTSYTGKISIAEDLYNSFVLTARGTPAILRGQAGADEHGGCQPGHEHDWNALKYNVRYGGLAGWPGGVS